MVKVSCILHYKCFFIPKFHEISTCCVHFNYFVRCNISKYDAVYFMGDNQAINRVRVGSTKTRCLFWLACSLSVEYPFFERKCFKIKPSNET